MSNIDRLKRAAVNADTPAWSGEPTIDDARHTRTPVWHIGDRVIVAEWAAVTRKGAGEVVDVDPHTGNVWVTLDDFADAPQSYLDFELRHEPRV